MMRRGRQADGKTDRSDCDHVLQNVDSEVGW